MIPLGETTKMEIIRIGLALNHDAWVDMQLLRVSSFWTAERNTERMIALKMVKTVIMLLIKPLARTLFLIAFRDSNLYAFIAHRHK